MTVSSTTARVSYSGNGSTTAFAASFYFLANSHLKVILRNALGVETVQVLNTDYTVTGAGNPAGGTVTMVVAPPTGTTLTIARNVPLTQEVDYQPNDPFPAESHEQALDKLTMIAQQQSDTNNRSLYFPITDSASLIGELPNSAARANRYLAFDSTGEPTVDGTLPEEIYLGAKNSDPATRNDGTALQAGDLYFYTVSNAMRVYNGAGWQDVTLGTSYPSQLFSGNGATTAFTLSSTPGSLGSIEVFISGVRQKPTVDYLWSSGTTLTFTSAPAAGTNNIFVRWVTTQAINVPADGSVTNAKMAAGAAVANIGYTPADATTTVNLTGAQSIAGAKRGTVVALTDGATITADFAAGNNFSVTLGGNRTLANPTNQTAGQSGVITITQDGTGSRTLAYGSNWKFPQGAAPVLTTTANAVDVLCYYVESATRITARLISDVK